MKVPKVKYSEDGMDELGTEDVELSEYFKEAQIQYTHDWGNGGAIIISFEETVTDEEQLLKAIKEALGL